MSDEPVKDYTNCVTFNINGVEVGCFDFGQSPATFTGDVDTSARMFVDAVLSVYEAQRTKGEPE